MALCNTIDAVEDGRRLLQPFFEDLQLDRAVVNRIEVVFEELVSNIVRHGFAPGSGQSIRVRVAPQDDAVELTFEDDGAPFDPFSAKPPAPFTSLEAAPLGGLGIPLIIRLTDARRYERLAAASQADGFAPTNRVTVVVSAGKDPAD
jgi:anti-sigma regulatory factor (Ser/Thr protein kinase)